MTDWKPRQLPKGYNLPPEGTFAGRPQLASRRPLLDAEVAVLHVRRFAERGGGPTPHHPAAFDQIMPVGDTDEGLDVLVDHQNCKAVRLEAREARTALKLLARRFFRRDLLVRPAQVLARELREKA